jgi:hypothetical protein
MAVQPIAELYGVAWCWGNRLSDTVTSEALVKRDMVALDFRHRTRHAPGID